MSIFKFDVRQTISTTMEAKTEEDARRRVKHIVNELFEDAEISSLSLELTGVYEKQEVIK